jgi:hypothetical protein
MYGLEVSAYWVLVGNRRESDHLEDLGLGGRITLKCNFNKYNWKHGMGCCGLGQGQVGGCCGHDDEP